jgi:hypothetical protein
MFFSFDYEGQSTYCASCTARAGRWEGDDETATQTTAEDTFSLAAPLDTLDKANVLGVEANGNVEKATQKKQNR